MTISLESHSQLLKLCALLLDYPRPEVREESLALHALIRTSDLPEAQRDGLAALLNELCQGDLLDVQARYDGLFERGRSVSLLLFEHVHGESRDRGQAMVDLLAEYEAAGFQLDARELPDHLPLFLEYLSTRSHAEIGQWLGDIQHILALLAARLEERGADHALVPHALLALIGRSELIQQQRPAVEGEAPDHTPQALDAVWEEEIVRFNAETDQDCSLQSAEGRRLAERKYQALPQVVQVLPATPSPLADGQ